MHLFRNNPWIVASRLILFTLAVPGCHNDPKTCNDIAPGAIPQPSGTYVCQWNNAETARADRDNFVIYHYEWSADGTKLTPFGREHIAMMAQGLPQVCFPVVIEPVSDQRLNDMRRMAVLAALANCRVQIAPDRVILGRPEAEGLYGQEAPGIAGAMLGNLGGGGAGATGGGATGGGATGAMGGGATGSTGSGGGIGLY